MDARRYEFDGYCIDATQRRLHAPDGQRIALTPKAFDTLLMLVENAGAIVEKRVLLKTIWPSLVVDENNLNQAIAAARRALRDDDKRYIATIPGRGYQFVAKVTRLETGESHAGKGMTKPLSATPGAYHEHLLGWSHWHRPNSQSIERSLKRYARAIELDPGLASAYAGMAGTYVLLALYGFRAPAEVYPKARELCVAALEIDRCCVDAHIWLSQIKRQFDHDWEGSAFHSDLALSLAPNESLSNFARSLHLATLGMFPEATVLMQRAYELEPLSPAISASLGHVLYHARAFDQAAAQLLKTVELDDAYDFAHSCLGRCYLMMEQFDQAIDQFRRCTATSPGSRADLARAYALCGRHDDARSILVTLQRESRERYVSAYELAAVQVALGDLDGAFISLDRAIEERAPLLWFIAVDPAMDEIRGDARFVSLLQKLRLPTIARANEP